MCIHVCKYEYTHTCVEVREQHWVSVPAFCFESRLLILTTVYSRLAASQFLLSPPPIVPQECEITDMDSALCRLWRFRLRASSLNTRA